MLTQHLQLVSFSWLEVWLEKRELGNTLMFKTRPFQLCSLQQICSLMMFSAIGSMFMFFWATSRNNKPNESTEYNRHHHSSSLLLVKHQIRNIKLETVLWKLRVTPPGGGSCDVWLDSVAQTYVWDIWLVWPNNILHSRGFINSVIFTNWNWIYVHIVKPKVRRGKVVQDQSTYIPRVEEEFSVGSPRREVGGEGFFGSLQLSLTRVPVRSVFKLCSLFMADW